MLRLLVVCIWCILLLASNIAPAFAVSFSPALGYGQGGAAFFPEVEGVTTASRSYSLLYGALIDFKMTNTLSMELGFIYGGRGFSRVDSLSTTQTSFTMMQTPLLLKFNFVPAISVGVGAYYAYGLGSIGVSNASGDSQEVYYAVNTYRSEDHGLVASAAVKIKVAPFVSVFLDGRYLMGLRDISLTSGTTTYLRDVQVLSGVRFGR